MPSFGDREPELLIVGLAPGLRGANRTGRPFTGDYAGDLLYRTLAQIRASRPGDYGADIRGRARTAPRPHHQRGALRAAAKQAGTAEIAACGRFLAAELAASPRLRAILALGAIAHDAVLAAKGLKRRAPTHSRTARCTNCRTARVLADSYHCSRLNTNTGTLTAADVRGGDRRLAERLRSPAPTGCRAADGTGGRLT